MNFNKNRLIAQSALFACVLLMGFSDTAFGQATTLTTDAPGNTLSLVVPANGSGNAQFHVTSNVSTTAQIYTNNSPSWLTLSPSGPFNISGNTSTLATVNVNLANTNYPTGTTLSGTFGIGVFGQGPQITITVNVSVGVSSILSANPSSLTFTAQQGAVVGVPSSTNVHVLSSGAQLSYTLTTTTSDGGSWLLVTPVACTVSSPCTTALNSPGFTVSVNPTGLVASSNPYTGTITAQSTTSLDAVAISVSLTVNSGPTVTVSPTTLQQFLYQVSTGTAPITQQTVNVSSTGGNVPFTVSLNPPVAWLVLGTSSSTTGSSPVPVTLNLSKAGIPSISGTSATFNTSVVITPSAGPAPASIPVSLLVSNNALLSITNSNSLIFSGNFGGPAPATQQVTLTSTGAAVNFSVAQDPNAPWLTVTPLNGTASSTSPVNLTFTANPSSPSVLAVGNYNANIVITPSNGDQYTIPISVQLQVGSASQLTAAPALVHFSYQTTKTQLPLPSQVVSLGSTGQPVPFTITIPPLTATANCPASWLSATTSSSLSGTTPASLTVSVNAAGMTAGSCTGNVLITPSSGTGGTALTIPVVVDISASPELSINPPAGFGVTSAQQGAAAFNVQGGIPMTSTDSQNQVQFSATSNQNWLLVNSNLTTSTPSVLSVIISPGSLTPGTYNGAITISSSSLPSSTVNLPYTLTITPNVTISVTPSGTLSFTQAQGGPVPSPKTLSLVANGGTANYTATVIPVSGGNWLKLSSNSGTINSTGSLTVSIDPTVANALAANQNPYVSQISLAFPGTATTSMTITVNLTVTSQTLSVTPQSLQFSYTVGGSTPATQPVTVSTTGGSVTFTASATSTGNWLSIDATTGTTPKTINVSVNPANFPAGTAVGTPLTGTISIFAASLPSNPVVVTVTATTVAPPAPQPTKIFNSGSAAFGAISPGELITITGAGLGPVTPASFSVTSQGTVSNTLSGVQVSFDGNLGIPTYVSSTQINVIVPYEVTGRTATNITVIYQGVPSAVIPQTITTVAPSIYTFTGDGKGQVAAYNVSDGKINGPLTGLTINGVGVATEPAAVGSYIAVYGTGGGATDPPGTTGSLNSTTTLMPLHGWTATSNTVTATIGGVPAKVTFAGAAPGLVTGVDQFDIQIPAGVASGAQPIVITINGVTTQLNGPTVSIQ